MENGNSDSPQIITPPSLKDAYSLTCHRFFAPVVFPEPDRIDPRKANITPRLGNFPCIRDRCMMWNSEAGECWDVSAAKGQALAGQYAYNKINDVHIEGQ